MTSNGEEIFLLKKDLDKDRGQESNKVPLQKAGTFFCLLTVGLVGNLMFGYINNIFNLAWECLIQLSLNTFL